MKKITAILPSYETAKRRQELAEARMEQINLSEAILTKYKDSLLDIDRVLFYVADSLEMVADFAGKHTTGIATDGERLFYNPSYVLGMNQIFLNQISANTNLVGDQARKMADSFGTAVIAHEAAHVVAKHPFRRILREDRRYQAACDAVVNSRLAKIGFSLPLDAFRMDTLPDGRSASQCSVEEVYRVIENQSRGGPPKTPKWGGTNDNKPDQEDQSGNDKKKKKGSGEDYVSPADIDSASSRVDENVARALSRAREAGEETGNWESFIQAAESSPKDWRDELRQFLGQGEYKEPSWSRPNRRFIHQNIYLPGMARHTVGEIAAIVDTSGSVDDSLLKRYVSELVKIQEDLQPEKIHIICIDTEVKWTESYGPYDVINVKALGRGGTRFAPAFEFIKKRGWDIKAAAYFTDLECSDFGSAPDYPVLWVAWPGYSKATASRLPFGRIIRMEDEYG